MPRRFYALFGAILVVIDFLLAVHFIFMRILAALAVLPVIV